MRRLKRLTDRQIWDVYFHERDEKTGRLKPSREHTSSFPERFATIDDKKRTFEQFARGLGMSAAWIKSKWEEKHGTGTY